jgi:hypothetical protein
MLRLPLAAPGQDGKKHIIVCTGGTPNIPVKIKAATIADEKEAVECLATEMQERMAIDLETKPIINRWPDISAVRLGAANVKNFLLVGMVHVKGDLIVISKSAQLVVFNAIRPMLDAARGRHCIVMAPMPRYIFKGCCESSEHLTNRGHSAFRQQLMGDVKDVAVNIKDFCFTTGY